MSASGCLAFILHGARQSLVPNRRSQNLCCFLGFFPVRPRPRVFFSQMGKGSAHLFLVWANLSLPVSWQTTSSTSAVYDTQCTHITPKTVHQPCITAAYTTTDTNYLPPTTSTHTTNNACHTHHIPHVISIMFTHHTPPQVCTLQTQHNTHHVLYILHTTLKDTPQNNICTPQAHAHPTIYRQNITHIYPYYMTLHTHTDTHTNPMYLHYTTCIPLTYHMHVYSHCDTHTCMHHTLMHVSYTIDRYSAICTRKFNSHLS